MLLTFDIILDYVMYKSHCMSQDSGLEKKNLPRDFKQEEIKELSPCKLLNGLGQEATVRIGHGTTDWLQIGKEYIKAIYCHPVYLTYMQSTS